MSATAVEIIKQNEALVGLMTSFNNEIGPSNGNDLRELYADYGLSDPPLEAEFSAMSTKDRIAYRKAERAIEVRAIAMNDIHDALIAIDPGSGPFGSLDSVKAWAVANMGNVGADIGSNIDAFKAIRVRLAAFISPAMLAEHSAAVNAFTDELDSQIAAGNVRP